MKILYYYDYELNDNRYIGYYYQDEDDQLRDSYIWIDEDGDIGTEDECVQSTMAGEIENNRDVEVSKEHYERTITGLLL